MIHVVTLVCGFALDALLGDPYRMPHIIRLIGRLIAGVDATLRRVVPHAAGPEHAAGVVLVLMVVGVSAGAAIGLLWLAWHAAAWVGFVVETFVCYQMLAARQLRVEARRVYDELARGDVSAARMAVSMIVGRDTEQLDEAGVTRAAVETVAENTSDGVVAPLLWMAVGGAVGGVVYKAVNTMDSMVDRFGEGVKTEKVDSEHFRLKADVADSHVFYAWIFGFSGKVIICAPEEMKVAYGKMLKDALRFIKQ